MALSGQEKIELLIYAIFIIILPVLSILSIKIIITFLTMLGNAWAVKHLIRFLEYSKWPGFMSPEGQIQARAARALGKIGSVQAVEALIRALRHEYSSVREVAVEALGELGDVRVVEPLIQALGNSELRVRMKAIKVLEQIGSPAIEPLIQALGDKKDVRAGAAEMLGRLGNGRAVEPLIKVLEDRNSDVRANAAEALDNIGWKPENVMENIFYFLARKDWEGLVSLGVPAIEPLTEISEDHISFFIREDAEVGLKKLYASIETIIFGNIQSTIVMIGSTLLNPEVLTLTLPMSNLKRLEIHTETFNFHQVERFLTYAVNYVGQKHLKKNVEVDIYGDPDKLHPNLRNNFEHLCKRVKFIRPL